MTKIVPRNPTRLVLTGRPVNSNWSLCQSVAAYHCKTNKLIWPPAWHTTSKVPYRDQQYVAVAGLGPVAMPLPLSNPITDHSPAYCLPRFCLLLLVVVKWTWVSVQALWPRRLARDPTGHRRPASSSNSHHWSLLTVWWTRGFNWIPTEKRSVLDMFLLAPARWKNPLIPYERNLILNNWYNISWHDLSVVGA
jgi:hypothetical protein